MEFSTKLKTIYPIYTVPCTLLGGSSFARFCQQEFGEFPRPAWAVGSYSSGPLALGTPQILVDKTLRMTSRLRVYNGARLGSI